MFVMVSQEGRAIAMSCTFHIENGGRRHCFRLVTDGKPLLTTLTKKEFHFKGTEVFNAQIKTSFFFACEIFLVVETMKQQLSGKPSLYLGKVSFY